MICKGKDRYLKLKAHAFQKTLESGMLVRVGYFGTKYEWNNELYIYRENDIPRDHVVRLHNRWNGDVNIWYFENNKGKRLRVNGKTSVWAYRENIFPLTFSIEEAKRFSKIRNKYGDL